MGGGEWDAARPSLAGDYSPGRPSESSRNQDTGVPRLGLCSSDAMMFRSVCFPLQCIQREPVVRQAVLFLPASSSSAKCRMTGSDPIQTGRTSRSLA